MGVNLLEVCMENLSFEVLEEKINKIIDMLERIKKENQELRQKNKEFKQLLYEKEQIIQTLKTESESNIAVNNEIDNYRKNQDRIREKVEALLSKLKEFEDFE
jgi:DNA repair exonuclease SbcCD ATPase subunit